MRLIDADYLKELITDYPEWNKFDKNRAIKTIDNTPTIEDRPQGEWISVVNEHGAPDLVCSKCNEHYYPSFVRPIYSFCPYCGADMNGGTII